MISEGKGGEGCSGSGCPKDNLIDGSQNTVDNTAVQGLKLSVVAIAFREIPVIFQANLQSIHLFVANCLDLLDDDPLNAFSAGWCRD